MAAGVDLLGAQAGRVAGRVQLGGHRRVGGGEGAGLVAGADGAARSGGAGPDGGLPGVPGRAAPPQLAVGAGGDPVEVDAGVADRVGLGGEVGMGVAQPRPELPGLQGPETPLPVGADGTAGPAGPVDHLGLPAVAFGAAPPHLPLRPGGQGGGVDPGVAVRVELGGQVGVGGGDPGRVAPSAGRTARAGGPAAHPGLPDVAGGAAPPQPALRPGGHTGRFDAGVAVPVELADELGMRHVQPLNIGDCGAGPVEPQPEADHRRRGAELDAEVVDPAALFR